MRTSTEPNHDFDAVIYFFVCFVLALVFFLSCSTSRPLPPPPLVDSTRIEVRERIVHVHDTLTVEVPAQTQNNATRDSTSFLETDFASSRAQITSDGTLLHTLTNKKQKFKAPIDTIYRTRDSIVYRDKKVPVPTPYPVEKKLSKWEQLKTDVGGIALVILFIWLIRLFYRIVRVL